MAVLTGGCQCGAVRYAVSEAPLRASLCSCRMCQKAVGGPFAALAAVLRDNLRWTRGLPAAFRSSSIAVREFCPFCGTPLTFGTDHDPAIGVSIGSLDRPEAVPPTTMWGAEAEVSWMTADLLASLPRRRTEEDTTLAGLVSYQHPDHDTPNGWTPDAG